MKPAERKPQVEPSHVARLLAAITSLVVRAPLVVLVAAVVLAAMSAAYTVMNLGVKTSRLDLLNPRSRYNQRWLEYIEEFGDDEDAVVVVEGPDREQVTAAIDAIAADLGRSPETFSSLLWKVDLSPLRSKALPYASNDQLAQLEQFAETGAAIARGNWTQLKLAVYLPRLVEAATSSDPAMQRAGRAQLAALAKSLEQSLAGNALERASPWPNVSLDAAPDPTGNSEYFLLDRGRTGLILLHLAEHEESFTGYANAVNKLRTALADFERNHPEIEVGLTGLPVLETDEMQLSQRDSIKASFLSLLGVASLFVAAFGSLRHPLLAVAALGLGIALAFGYVTFAVGHLNILSMAFGAILIGLGVDFGIHYVARYRDLRDQGNDSAAALIETARTVGPGIVTGGLTTAIAFFTAGLTDFTGVVELGIIAGGGVVVCMLCALIVLPALIQVSDRNRPSNSHPRILAMDVPLGWITRAPRVALGLSLVLTALLAIGVNDVWYDHNLLNLQPERLESVVLERELLRRNNRSAWYALSIADSREELFELKRQFESLDLVDRTEEVVSLLPSHYRNQTGKIEALYREVSDLPQEPPLIPTASPEELTDVFSNSARRLDASDQNLQTLAAELEAIAERMQRLPASEAYERISAFQQRMAVELLARLKAVRQVADPEPPSFRDLPPGLVDRFVGQSGWLLLKVYSNTNIWDMDGLERFVAAVRSVDPHATGQPLQAFEASQQMQRSYIHAALYSLLAIGAVLMLDFRSVGDVLLALVPVSLGMLQLFGLLGLFHIPLNPANMIVLPLILGIGIDDGVHVVHDYRRSQGRYRVSRSTATAIIVTSVTTMIGFGSLMIASHRGLESLGRVLTIGVACCMFTSLVALPAMLRLFGRRRERPAEETSRSEEKDEPEPSADANVATRS